MRGEGSATGGELTLSLRLSAVGPDFLLLCRSSPVGDVRCDLIGAWQRPRASLVRRVSTRVNERWTRLMMVLGADTHKRSHTVAAVAASTGELQGEKTVGVGVRG